ncbi:MAG: hypothetical protein K2R98_06345 [Gemmataceae bacterium]|nr:hypothetical protein [Gemmataceae bacterium]
MTAETIAPGVQSASDDILFRGNLYAEGIYAKTDVVKGVTRNRLGTRLCSLSEDFLLGMRRAIVDECGSAADAVFKSCGKRWGALLARRFEKEMSEFYGKAIGEFSMSMFLGCLVELFSHHGWGKLNLDLTHYEEGLLIAELRSAIMADLVKEADQPADTLFAGIFGGFFATLTGEDLDCVQTTCTACGADASRFVIGLTPRLADVEAWRNDGTNHADIIANLAQVRVKG